MMGALIVAPEAAAPLSVCACAYILWGGVFCLAFASGMDGPAAKSPGLLNPVSSFIKVCGMIALWPLLLLLPNGQDE